MVTILLCAAAIAVVSLLACRQQRDAEPEPTEFGASFDALQAEKDEAAKMRARCREREAINRAADRMISHVALGRPHDPVEL